MLGPKIQLYVLPEETINQKYEIVTLVLVQCNSMMCVIELTKVSLNYIETK